MPSGKWQRRVAVAASLVLWALYLLPAQLAPSHFVHDDSYFYVQIAQNVVSGRGSTFHGITPTNGYHPLWLLVCVFALAASGGSKPTGLHLVAFVQAVLLLGIVIAFRHVARLAGLSSAALGMLVLAGFFMSTGLCASEAHLNGFTLGLGLYLLLLAPTRRGGRVWAGIVLGLAILARLDNVFVVGALVAASLYFAEIRDPRQLLARGIAVLGPILILVGAYLAYNLAVYGHAMPISGAIKSTFPRPAPDLDNLSTLGKFVTVLALASLLLSFVRRWPTPLRICLAGLGAGVLGHSSYVVLFTEHYTFWTWYYVPGVLNAALLAVVAADRVKSFRADPLWQRAARIAVNAGCVLLAGGGLTYAWGKALEARRIGPFELERPMAVCRWPEQLGAWMKTNLPADSGVLVYDWPGALAFASDLRILPADGLINDYGYNAELPALGAREYMRRHGVSYYFGRRTSEPGPVGPQRELRARAVGPGWQELEIYTPLTKDPGGTFRISDRDLVVRVQDVVDCPEQAPDAAIWRLPPPPRATSLPPYDGGAP